MADQKLCSKCGQNPRASEDGTNPWCNACKTKYQKEYQETRLVMMEQRGFGRGVDAMVETLVREFSRHGRATMSAAQVAQAIAVSPRPTYR